MDSGNYLAPSYSSRSFNAYDKQQTTSNVASRTSYTSGSTHNKGNNYTSGSPAAWHPASSVGFRLGTPDVINRIEVKNSASSVVLAFRELQEKSKQIEFERIAAASEVEDLKRRLSESRRNESLHRSRSEIRTTDEVLMVREHCERLLQETGELQALLSRATETGEGVHREIAFHRTRISELNEETSRNHIEVQSLEYRISQLQEDAHLSVSRAEEIEQKLLSLKSSHTVQINNEHRMSQLHNKMNREKSSSLRSSARISALQRYMEIILQVNGDLTEALKNKEISSSRIFRIVESHTKHMASRDSIHTKSTANLLHVPNSPSRTVRRRSTDDLHSAAKATKKTKKVKKLTKFGKKSVLDADNQDEQYSEVLSSKASKKSNASGKRMKKTKKMGKEESLSAKKKIASMLDILDTGNARDPRDEPSRLYTDDNYEASLLSRIEELRREKALYAEAVRRMESVPSADGDEDSQRGSKRTSLGSSLLNKTASSAGRSINNSHSVGSSRGGTGPESSLDSSRSDWLLKPNLNPRYHDRTMFDATGGANSEDRRISMTRSSSADPERGRNARINANSRRPRSLSSHSRGQESGLVQTAGRLAATAAATAAVAAANVEESGRVGRIFVPSSPCESKEFNVMASVSKAARSAREMNATLASRVKSLDFDGCGPQFNEITKIDLADMHDYLTVVKKLRESGTSR